MKPGAVESDMKCSAHTWLGRSACNRLAGTVLSPSCRRLGELWGTLSACSGQIRCTRLWFICQPSFRSPPPPAENPTGARSWRSPGVAAAAAPQEPPATLVHTWCK
jgi:hypothetical protein